MLRIFFFLLLVSMLGFGFAWFADRPGDVVLEWQGAQYKTSLMVVLVAMVLVVAMVMITWWLLRSVLDSPHIVRRFFYRRKRDHGYAALTNGLIAANSGDTAAARRFAKESNRLLGRGPLVDLLDAQTLLLEGRRDDAKARFEEMLGDDKTRLVALRGLYVEAERQGATEAARHYAGEAHKLAPTLAWAGNAKLRYASREGDWEGALATLEANRSSGLITREEAKRQRAVLLTAQAMAEEPADPGKAAKLAREAHKLAPELVPAAVIGAKALMRNNDIGRAAGMIEKVWKQSPHPELADAYVHLRIGDSATDRLKRAKKLAAMKANHAESSFAIAQAAIDTQDWQLARNTLKGILSTAPSERACLMMADVEEGEFGDNGRMRDWLSRALRAPKDAAWTADGYVSEKWLPFSPVTGRIDAFEWKVPVEQIGGPQTPVLDADSLDELMAEPKPASSSQPALPAGGVAAAVAGSEAFDAATPGEADADPAESAQEASKTMPAGDVIEPEDMAVQETDDAGREAEDAILAETEIQSEMSEDSGTGRENQDEPVIAFGRSPDDPGVSDEDPPEERRKRFGIF